MKQEKQPKQTKIKQPKMKQPKTKQSGKTAKGLGIQQTEQFHRTGRSEVKARKHSPDDLQALHNRTGTEHHKTNAHHQQGVCLEELK